MVQFSHLGATDPLIQAYTQRLVCTNGMVSNQVMASFTGGGGEGDNVWQWFRRSVSAAYRALGPIVERYQEMVREGISPEERAQVLEGLLERGEIG